ncbi:hypothetical protein [Desulfoluna butyratoxydans]|uniref:Uncharacterized protein n=1 Tax=Desulfoluna butyratoxydans TaxID=231438 RepID=A0A4U8YH06_9BACT|nr:hypothetical protein [Desulfoluna butyratoxydans]VFQ42414.1 hypothetical protein MSL71_320 [Desulfoluna butyratoxydans]
MATKPRLRRAARLVGDESGFKGAFLIEINSGNGWLPLGDDSGILAFHTKEERDAVMADYQARIDAKEDAGNAT